jgi:kynurenine formamidase
MRYIVLIYNIVKKNLKNCKDLQGNAMVNCLRLPAEVVDSDGHMIRLLPTLLR